MMFIYAERSDPCIYILRNKSGHEKVNEWTLLVGLYYYAYVCNAYNARCEMYGDAIRVGHPVRVNNTQESMKLTVHVRKRRQGEWVNWKCVRIRRKGALIATRNNDIKLPTVKYIGSSIVEFESP